MKTTATPQSQSPGRLAWFTPRWSVSRELKVLVPLVFGTGPVVRIVCVSLVAVAAIALGVKIAIPQIQLGPIVWKTLLFIPAMFLYLGSFFVIHYAIPTYVSVGGKYITRLMGQSVWHAKLTEIESSRLVVYSPKHIQLVIRIRGKPHRLAIAPGVDLDRLVSLIGTTEVVDMRERFAAARALVDAARKAKISNRQKKHSPQAN